MQHVDVQPHIHLSKKDMHPVVIVVGDPGRALKLAGMCDEHKELKFNREYRSFDCTKDGEKFIVISHGVGSAGAAICFEEVIACGAKVVFRAGTAGSLKPEEIKQGDVVVCEAAVREDGISQKFVPHTYPAIADLDVISSIKEAADEHGSGAKIGITLTTDVFYQSPVLDSDLKLWQRAGVEVVSMEEATLFTISRIRGIKAGGLCVVDGCPLDHENNYDPQGTIVEQGKTNMLEIALKAAVKMTKSYKH